MHNFINYNNYIKMLINWNHKPFVWTVAIDFCNLASQIRTVLSRLAVANRSGFDGCQQSWSTLSLCPLNVCSLLWKKINTLLSLKNVIFKLMYKKYKQN